MCNAAQLKLVNGKYYRLREICDLLELDFVLEKERIMADPFISTCIKNAKDPWFTLPGILRYVYSMPVSCIPGRRLDDYWFFLDTVPEMVLLHPDLIIRAELNIEARDSLNTIFPKLRS